MKTPINPSTGAAGGHPVAARGLGHWEGFVTLLLTLLGWSSVPLFLEHFTGQIDFWTANGWRYGFSALLWAPALVFAARARTLPRGLWRAAVVPSMFNCAGQTCFAAIPYAIEPGLMTFGLRVQIIFLTIGAAILFPAERRVIGSPWFLAGIALVLLGTVGVVALTPGFALSSKSGAGVGMAVGSGLLFACYSLSVRHFMHGMRPLLAFAAISQYTAAGTLGLMLAFGARQGGVVLEMAAGQVGLLLLSSLIGIGLGHTFYYTSIARLGVAVSAGVLQLQPFVVGVASFFMFGERLSAAQWACGGAAVAGAGAILWVQGRTARAARRGTPPIVPAATGRSETRGGPARR